MGSGGGRPGTVDGERGWPARDCGWGAGVAGRGALAAKQGAASRGPRQRSRGRPAGGHGSVPCAVGHWNTRPSAGSRPMERGTRAGGGQPRQHAVRGQGDQPGSAAARRRAVRPEAPVCGRRRPARKPRCEDRGDRPGATLHGPPGEPLCAARQAARPRPTAHGTPSRRPGNHGEWPAEPPTRDSDGWRTPSRQPSRHRTHAPPNRQPPRHTAHVPPNRRPSRHTTHSRQTATPRGIPPAPAKPPVREGHDPRTPDRQPVNVMRRRVFAASRSARIAAPQPLGSSPRSAARSRRVVAARWRRNA